LYFNQNPTVELNKINNLCFLEELTDPESTNFLYPLANKYYCLGYAAERTGFPHNTMIYYVAQECLNYNPFYDRYQRSPRAANECLKEKMGHLVQKFISFKQYAPVGYKV
jgi:hypothetical protein